MSEDIPPRGQKDSQSEQTLETGPGISLKQKVVAFNDHNFDIRPDRYGTGDSQITRAVETRKEPFGVGMLQT